MKRVIRTENLQKTFIITDNGEELLIEVSRNNNRTFEYLTLTDEEKTESIKGWKELDKVLRLELKADKDKRQKAKS